VKSSGDHFSQVATAYAACRPDYPASLFSYLARLTLNHDLAWDCAAGSGQATLPLAEVFQRVLATDVSRSMLDRAPRHPRVEYRASPAEQSGLDDESADLVSVAQALHWLDLDTFYAEVERVLRPGGILAVWSYGGQQLGDDQIDRILARFYSEVVGPYWPEERRHVEDGYQSLRLPYAPLETPAFAMVESWSLGQLIGYIGTWSATQRYRESQGQDPVPQLADELSLPWGDPSSTRLVRWPLILKVGRKAV
jgi:SAM-dependent methyltransferase